MKLRPFALERFFAKHEFSVKHLACASDPDSLSIREVLALEPGAEAKFLELGLGYGESVGQPDLRAAIASLFEGIAPEDTLVHAGAEEAIFAFMHVLLGPGDHAIVHTPAYQALYEVAESAGASVTRWEAREADGWQPDVEALARLIRPETKLIVINSPHNPTGALISRDRLDAIVALARKHGLWLFGDEVYRGVEYGAPQSPSVVELYDRGVSLGATAKVYGLAGLRIGWLVCRDRALLERVATFKDYLTICSPGPSEFLAAIALRHAEQLAGRTKKIVEANVPLVQRLIDERPEQFSWICPVAGTTGFVRYVPGGAERWTRGLLEESGVLFLPGPIFDFADTHFRIGLGRSALANWIQLV
ncbi:MAG: aminotransferase class I/II-fold pyridoxal phosphate-dependent enzyme [Archangium sp.]|nr:aminotransferase class I/II-fold pyridoxal phosphate-dependent enzyme [Archangium sp.]